jgi:hypothetical protein
MAQEVCIEHGVKGWGEAMVGRQCVHLGQLVAAVLWSHGAGRRMEALCRVCSAPLWPPGPSADTALIRTAIGSWFDSTLLGALGEWGAATRTVRWELPLSDRPVFNTAAVVSACWVCGWKLPPVPPGSYLDGGDELVGGQAAQQQQLLEGGEGGGVRLQQLLQGGDLAACQLQPPPLRVPRYAVLHA